MSKSEREHERERVLERARLATPTSSRKIDEYPTKNFVDDLSSKRGKTDETLREVGGSLTTSSPYFSDLKNTIENKNGGVNSLSDPDYYSPTKASKGTIPKKKPLINIESGSDYSDSDDWDDSLTSKTSDKKFNAKDARQIEIEKEQQRLQEKKERQEKEKRQRKELEDVKEVTPHSYFADWREDDLAILLLRTCDDNNIENSERNLGIVRQLIKMGVDVNAAYEDGSTALCLSIIKQKEVAKLLVESGCDVNLHAKNQSTPLMLCVQHCATSLVQMIVDAGGDVLVPDKQGNIAEDYVQLPKHRDILNILNTASASRLAKKEANGRTERPDPESIL